MIIYWDSLHCYVCASMIKNLSPRKFCSGLISEFENNHTIYLVGCTYPEETMIKYEDKIYWFPMNRYLAKAIKHKFPHEYRDVYTCKEFADAVGFKPDPDQGHIIPILDNNLLGLRDVFAANYGAMCSEDFGIEDYDFINNSDCKDFLSKHYCEELPGINNCFVTKIRDIECVIHNQSQASVVESYFSWTKDVSINYNIPYLETDICRIESFGKDKIGCYSILKYLTTKLKVKFFGGKYMDIPISEFPKFMDIVNEHRRD